MSFTIKYFVVLQVSTCDRCQKMNSKLTTATPELHPVPVQSSWFHLGMDFIGPISPVSSKRNRFILAISDYFKVGGSCAIDNKRIKCSCVVAQALMRV